MSKVEPASSPGIGAIASGLAGDIQDLVRGELALARAEVDEKVRGLVTIAVSIAGGALVGFAGLVVLLEGGAALLSKWMPLWAALLVIGAVIIVVGALVARAALAKLSLTNLKPERAAASVRKDARMIKEHA